MAVAAISTATFFAVAFLPIKASSSSSYCFFVFVFSRSKVKVRKKNYLNVCRSYLHQFTTYYF